MGFTGNLKTVSFGDILQLISTGKKTGVLQLLRANAAKKIYFRGGNIVTAAAQPSTIEERLGQVLLRRGQITADDLDKALKKQRSSGKRLGHVLIEMGILDRAIILDSLRAQVEEVVYSVFAWPEAEFRFLDGEAPDPGQILVELNTLNVMMEGARRFDEYAEVAHSLPDAATVLRLSPSPRMEEPNIVLTGEDIDVLVAVNGERSVSDIISSAAHGEYSASKSLHKLLKSSLVEPCPDAAERASRKGEEEMVYELIYRIYTHALQAVHKVLVEYLGPSGERLFCRAPEGWESDRSRLFDVLITPGGPVDSLQKEMSGIPDPVRLHRALSSANQILADRVRLTADWLGPGIAGRVTSGIQKDLSFLLAQKRSLADKYDIGRDIRQALRGV